MSESTPKPEPRLPSHPKGGKRHNFFNVAAAGLLGIGSMILMGGMNRALNTQPIETPTPKPTPNPDLGGPKDIVQPGPSLYPDSSNPSKTEIPVQPRVQAQLASSPSSPDGPKDVVLPGQSQSDLPGGPKDSALEGQLPHSTSASTETPTEPLIQAQQGGPEGSQPKTDAPGGPKESAIPGALPYDNGGTGQQANLPGGPRAGTIEGSPANLPDNNSGSIRR